MDELEQRIATLEKKLAELEKAVQPNVSKIMTEIEETISKCLAGSKNYRKGHKKITSPQRM